MHLAIVGSYLAFATLIPVNKSVISTIARIVIKSYASCFETQWVNFFLF